jgi:thiol:disulfide interchange protein DsbA
MSALSGTGWTSRGRQLLRLLCLLLLGCGLTPAVAQPLTLVAGQHYQELATPLADADPDRIEVAELFWYGCPSCYDLLPTLQIWEASYRTSDLSFTRLPVVWSAIMATHARLYLTAEVLGLVPAANKSSWEVTPTFHNTLFDAVQRDGRALRSGNEAADLFVAAGVTRTAFEAAWQDSAVETRLATLRQLPGPEQIPRLPALLVEGRYLITLNDTVTTTDDLFKVLSQLVVNLREAKRRAAR